MQKNTGNYNAFEVMIIKKSKRRCHTMLVNFSETALHSQIYKAESFQEASTAWGLQKNCTPFLETGQNKSFTFSRMCLQVLSH